MGGDISTRGAFYGSDVSSSSLFLLIIMGDSKAFFSQKNLRTSVILGMVLIFLIASYASWKQFERHSRIKAEVAVLIEERERVRKENESLKERINYFATENFQEQESKERLNMRKDNEYVVDIERIQKNQDVKIKSLETNTASEETVPNYKKWWAKFF